MLASFWFTFESFALVFLLFLVEMFKMNCLLVDGSLINHHILMGIQCSAG
jgi:hypothetical protein